MTDLAQSRFGPPLTLLPSRLRETGNAAASILIGWVLAFLPSILIAALLSLVLPSGVQPKFEVNGLYALFLIVVFSPIVETAVMGTALLLLLRVVNPTTAVLMSSIGWGLAHSAMAPAWGLVIWWPFLIFSTLFVVWRQRSLLAAFAVPAVVHALHNLPSALMLLVYPNGAI